MTDTTEAERLREALESVRRAAAQFAFYADEHRKKGTAEANAKAHTNAGWALELEEAHEALAQALRTPPAEDLVEAAWAALEALRGLNLKPEHVVGAKADHLVLRVPMSVLVNCASAHDALLAARVAQGWAHGEPFPSIMPKAAPSPPAAPKAEQGGEERAHGITIDQRDAAEEALSQAYALVIGERPEWSNLFGYRQALEAIDERVFDLQRQAAPTPKVESASSAGAGEEMECAFRLWWDTTRTDELDTCLAVAPRGFDPTARLTFRAGWHAGARLSAPMLLAELNALKAELATLRAQATPDRGDG